MPREWITVYDTEGSARGVQAEIMGDLAVHAPIGKWEEGWAVSHKRCGVRFPLFPSKKIAIAFAESVQNLDWNFNSVDQITDEMKAAYVGRWETFCEELNLPAPEALLPHQ